MSPETPESPTPSMNQPLPRHPGYTLEDWRAWEGRWELIEGMAFDMTPAPSTEHQRISVALTARLFQALEAARGGTGGPCQVFHAPTDLFLDGNVFQPDLLIVCDPAKVSARGIEGPPDLVVEILSPATAAKDTVRKRWAYEAGGIPEYLIVDPEQRLGLLLRLEGGRYEEAARIEWGSAVALLGGTLTVALV